LQYFSNNFTMASEQTKQRVSTVVSMAKTTFKFGFLPYVLYLGTLI